MYVTLPLDVTHVGEVVILPGSAEHLHLVTTAVKLGILPGSVDILAGVIRIATGWMRSRAVEQSVAMFVVLLAIGSVMCQINAHLCYALSVEGQVIGVIVVSCTKSFQVEVGYKRWGTQKIKRSL